MRFAYTLFFIAVFSFYGIAQTKPDIIKYIRQYKHIAIEEMVRTRIPASITLAQGILESGCGKSPLSTHANNHFGIKCKSDWTGKKYFQDDDEAQECFRVYEHAEASYVDHSDFLLTRYRYAPLFQLPADDYKSWAKGLKEVGYATNPNYAQLLISYIDNYNLHEYDQTGLRELEKKELLLSHSENPKSPLPVVENRVNEGGLKTDETQVPNPNEAKPATNGREEFLVNGLRTVRAIGNEDPLKIAFEYGIDYSFVMVHNDLSTGERFNDGENIFLQPKKSAGETSTYTVKSGESMRDISQLQGIKLKDLYLHNQMKFNEQVYAGEVLYLQDRRPQPPRVMSYYEFLRTQSKNKASAQKTILNNPAEYQVQQTDTLYSIARKFNTTVEQLKALNNLETAEVKAGQVLVVSQ